MVFRVLSYNIHKGYAAGNRSFVLDGIKDGIRESRADIVFLQEVIGSQLWGRRKNRNRVEEAQFEYLADEVWPHFAYGRNSVTSKGHHGNAILSKYPIVEWENIDISTNKIEKRGMLHAVVSHPSGGPRLHCICVHLGLFKRDRTKQIQQICARIQEAVGQDDAVVLGGDFNDWTVEASEVLEREMQTREIFELLHGEHVKTFPSWRPTLRLDRLYVRGIHVRSAEVCAGAGWRALSDHIPVIAELAWPK